MPQNIQSLLDKYLSDVKKIYGSHLKNVILYGSYARGDYTADSDVDIMILVDLDDAGIVSMRRALYDMTFEYNFGNDMEIMPMVKNIDHFNKWLRAYPFYNNVKREGVELYAA